MNNEKLGQDPAFPDPARSSEQSILNQSPWENPSGMSKRFYAACAAMQGLIIISSYPHSKEARETLIEDSYAIADELLKQENE